MDILKRTLCQTFQQTAKRAVRQTVNLLTAGFITAGIAVYVTTPAIADQKMTLTPGFAPDPQIMTGTSGGTRETADCGYVKPANAPDYMVTLTAPFNFLRASVQAEGDVTLLVEGPNGRICSDDVNGLMPEISGPATVGTYSIWVGDYVGNADRGFNYQLTITTQQDGSAEPNRTRVSDRPARPRSTPVNLQSVITSSPSSSATTPAATTPAATTPSVTTPSVTTPSVTTATPTPQQDKQFKSNVDSWSNN